MKKLLAISLFFISVYATNEDKNDNKDTNAIISKGAYEAAKQDAIKQTSRFWQYLKRSGLYDQTIKVGKNIDAFSYNYPSVITLALLPLYSKFPRITYGIALSWVFYQVIYSRSKPPIEPSSNPVSEPIKSI